MHEEAAKLLPTEINLHAKSRLLSIVFSDGARFQLPCEYLRVFSKAAGPDTLVTGKEAVNIERIDPQGQYAIRILFDDGHDTGIYSWDTLYALGTHQEANWADYLQRLEQLDPVHSGHVDVAEDEGELALLEAVEGFVSVGGDGAEVSGAVQPFLEKIPDGGLVVHNKDSGGSGALLGSDACRRVTLFVSRLQQGRSSFAMSVLFLLII